MKNKKIIAEYFLNCGRMGELEGSFVCEEETLKSLYGKDIYFGEVLGKHSDIVALLEESDITIKTDDQDFIKLFEEIMGEGWSTGINPIHFYDPDNYYDEEDEE